LLLATEVAEHLRQQPSRLLGAVACARVLRHADEQRLRRFPDAPVALSDRFLRLGTRRLRPREGERRLGATRLEPVAQGGRRETVLAVARCPPAAYGGAAAVGMPRRTRRLAGRAPRRGLAESVAAPEA